MKILILGGNGFIGTNLTIRLSKDHQVIVLDRSLPKIELENVEYIKCESSNLALIDYHLRAADFLIHLVSSFIPSNSNSLPKETLKEIESILDILELLKYRKSVKLIYFSSGGAIYGNTDTEIINEMHPTNPISGYGLCKLNVENYIKFYASQFDIDCLIVRPSNPYGPFQRTDGKQGVIARFIHLASQKQKIKLINEGKDIRDFIYIDDLIDFVENSISNFVTGTFNVGSGSGVQICHIVELIEKKANLVFDKELFAKREFDVNRIVLDSSKAELIYTWKAKINIEEGISLFYKWLKTNKKLKNESTN